MVSKRPRRKNQEKKVTVAKPQMKRVRRKRSSLGCSSSGMWENEVEETPENAIDGCFETTTVKMEVEEPEYNDQVSYPSNSNLQNSAVARDIVVKEEPIEPIPEQQKVVSGVDTNPKAFESYLPDPIIVKFESDQETVAIQYVPIIPVHPLPVILLPPVKHFASTTICPSPTPSVQPVMTNRPHVAPTTLRSPSIPLVQPVLKSGHVLPKTSVVQKPTFTEAEDAELKSVRDKLSKLENWESCLVPAKYFVRCADNKSIWRKQIVSVVKLDSGDGKTSGFYHITKNNWLDQIYIPKFIMGQVASRQLQSAISATARRTTCANLLAKKERVIPQDVKKTSQNLPKALPAKKRRALPKHPPKLFPQKKLPVPLPSETNIDCPSESPAEPASKRLLPDLSMPVLSPIIEKPKRPLMKVAQRLILRPMSQTLSSSGKVQLPLTAKPTDLPPGIRLISKFPSFIKKISKKSNALKRNVRANVAMRLGNSRFGRQIKVSSALNQSPETAARRERYRCLLGSSLKFAKRQTNPLVLIGDLQRDFKEWVDKADNCVTRTEAEWRALFDVKRGLAKPRNKQAGGRPLKKFRGRKAQERIQKRIKENEARREEVRTTDRELPTLARLISESQYTREGKFIVEGTEFDVETLWDTASTVADLVAFTSFRMARPATGPVPLLSYVKKTKHHKSELYYSESK